MSSVGAHNEIIITMEHHQHMNQTKQSKSTDVQQTNKQINEPPISRTAGIDTGREFETRRRSEPAPREPRCADSARRVMIISHQRSQRAQRPNWASMRVVDQTVTCRSHRAIDGLKEHIAGTATGFRQQCDSKIKIPFLRFRDLCN